MWPEAGQELGLGNGLGKEQGLEHGLGCGLEQGLEQGLGGRNIDIMEKEYITLFSPAKGQCPVAWVLRLLRQHDNLDHGSCSRMENAYTPMCSEALLGYISPNREGLHACRSSQCGIAQNGGFSCVAGNEGLNPKTPSVVSVALPTELQTPVTQFCLEQRFHAGVNRHVWALDFLQLLPVMPAAYTHMAQFSINIGCGSYQPTNSKARGSQAMSTAEQKRRATSTAEQEGRATTTAEQEGRSTSTAEQQSRATSTAEQQNQATSTAEQ
ncbi:hypothetical protein QTP86_005858 [Hemibagrus guttatus]|nr:hypothetical protein QTP86_005858 [Hemibagrus guttatus]